MRNLATQRRWVAWGAAAGVFVGLLMALFGQDYEIAQESVPVSVSQDTDLQGVDASLLARQVAIVLATEFGPQLSDSESFRRQITYSAQVSDGKLPQSVEIFVIDRTNMVTIRVAGRSQEEAVRLTEAGTDALARAMSHTTVGPITIGAAHFSDVAVLVGHPEEPATVLGPWGYRRSFFPFAGLACGIAFGWLFARAVRLAAARPWARVAMQRSVWRRIEAAAFQCARTTVPQRYLSFGSPRFRPARRDIPMLVIAVVLVAASAQIGGRFFRLGPLSGYLVLTALVCAAGGLILLMRARVAISVAARRPWLVATMAWGLCSVGWSADPSSSFKTWLVVTILLGAGMVLPTLSREATDRWNLPGLLVVIFTTAGAISVALIELAPRWGVLDSLISADGSFHWNVGLYAWNSGLGVTGALAAAIAFGALLTSSRSVWLWLALIVDLAVVIVSRSATSLLAMLAAVAVMTMIRWSWSRIIGVVGVVWLSVVLLFPQLGVANRLFGLVGRTSDLTGRLPIWAAAIAQTKSVRLSGLGMGISPDLEPFFGAAVPHSHNGYLQVVVEMGLLGGVLFGVFLVVLGRDVVMRSGITSLGMLVFFLVANLANDYSLAPTTLALVLAYLAGTPRTANDVVDSKAQT